MKFHAPRSVSPSPVRGNRKPRSTSTFGLYSDSDSEDYYSEVEDSFDSSDSDVDTASSSSASGSTFELVRPRHIKHTPLEERQIEETISAIRLRTRYHDPYEEWEKRTRKDALNTARKEFSEHEAQRFIQQEQKHLTHLQQLSTRHAEEAASVQQRSEEVRARVQREEIALKEQWRKREKELWDRIEAAIKAEEEKVAKRLEEERKVKEEEERKVREEEERKRKEEELRRRLIEEKRLKEEAEKLKAEAENKKAEEELQREKEEEEQKKKIEEARSQEDGEETNLRKALHFGPAEDDWRVARTNLQNLKTGPLAFVKANKELKAECGRLRRLITPRIGQLTNDPESISKISRELLQIMKPTNARPHDMPVYIALCSSLAKSILLQAETEVAAEPRSAEALGQVAFSLCESLDNFAPIFFAKLVQRCGGWPIPIVPPNHNLDNKPWASREEFTKISGWRKSTIDEGIESIKDRSTRIAALMRVYFCVIKITPARGPLDNMFQLPRLWTWFARITGDTKLLQDPVAPWLIYTGLDVLGLEACNVWGKQWIKMLVLIHEGVTTGYQNGKLIGGDSPESAHARTRVMFALGNIINGAKP
ncbi:hypothetical protein CVT25_000374 [Psilocybe cyanescens]|uniref:mRNA export factor GLE1 n=1 Tax=Psilocybe cyanescens TaxID=93625 RepID=A0A409XF99_PSICY|nr:hypothetical protein CVT25_000374 [Psilocybe cyanescens]